MNWSQIEKSDAGTIQSWAESQPWAKAMASCQQDSEWHAEGDVWTHTKMVCDQLPSLDGWDEKSDEDRLVLLFTALFHDSAKPLTTETDEIGRVHAPKHSVKGESLAREILRELGCPLRTRELICKLVRFHGRPVFLMEREDPIAEVVKMSWLLRNDLLWMFALADNRGRKNVSLNDRSDDLIHLWAELSSENMCYDQPYPFENAAARIKFFEQEGGNLFYVPFEDYRCRVTMLCGVPGVGKDTWLMNNRPGLPIVSLDEIREDLDIDPTENQGAVAQEAQERCREHLREGRSFAFNATNILRPTRGRWRKLFFDYSAQVEAVYLEPPLETILGRNKQRSRRVPEEVIRRLLGKAEPPTEAEFHNVILEA